MRNLLCAVLLLPFLSALPAAQDSYDIIIMNGRIVDGSGNPWYRADVGIRGGRIARIGDLRQAKAARVVDAANRFVAPGFIDIHSHADRGLDDPALRFNQSFLFQGVTTSVAGVDGAGGDNVAAQAEAMLAHGIGTNLLFYVGHNAARRAVIGIENRAPSAAELDQMKAFIRRGMESGAFGISTGLQYIPGRYSDTREVIELSKIAAAYGGIYDTHYRDEFNNMLKSIEEGIEISEQAGLPVHFGHIKVIGEHNWGKMARAIELIDAARARGLDITADQYPWDNGAVSTLHAHLQVPPSLEDLHQLWRAASGFDGRREGGDAYPAGAADCARRSGESGCDPAGHGRRARRF